MNKTLELALTSLVPTLNGPMPPELVNLASSLLAQSRSKISSLKAEEEVARAYVCANLACERLKQPLNLPKIEPRPPCVPRVYNKLYKYFETSLLPPRPRGRPPKSLTGNPGIPTTTTASPAKQGPSTPSKPKQPPSARPTPQKPSTSTPSKSTTFTPTKPAPQPKGTVPPWIPRTISHLCTTLHAPHATPHVLSGVRTILTHPSPYLPNTRSAVPQPDKRDKLPALLIAVYFFVTTRLADKETTGAEYVRQRRAAMEALEAEPAGNGARGRERVEKGDVDEWLREISERGWLRLDWFEDVPEGAGLGGEEEAWDGGEDEAMEDGEGEGTRGNVRGKGRRRRSSMSVGKSEGNCNTLQSGLGTMMQDRVDYLSDERKLDFLDWKERILKRIEQVERERGAETHDDRDDGDEDAMDMS